MSLRIKVRHSGSMLDECRKQARVALVDLHGGLVLNSPVDEGTFRNAWTVDLQAMTIENTTDYAEPLANGHSPQAPDGWIETEIDRAFRL